MVERVHQRIGMIQLQVKADRAAHQITIDQQHPLAAQFLDRKGGLGRQGGGAGTGLGTRKSRNLAQFGFSGLLRRAQTANAAHGFALLGGIERSVQKLAGSRAQCQNQRMGIVHLMQADHEYFRPGNQADELAGLVEVGEEIDQYDLGLQLAQTQFQRLLGGVALQVAHHLERPCFALR